MAKTTKVAFSEKNRDLESAIEVILGLDRKGCLARWHEVFGRSPPKHLSIQFLHRVLIWQVQTSRLGEVPKQVDRRLNRLANAKTKVSIARPGSHLVREWNGRTYQVQVTSDGFVMDGKTWRSLSAIAKHITGAHWSGPRFFGVQ